MRKRLESVSANLSVGTSVGFGIKTSEEKEKRERSVRISCVVGYLMILIYMILIFTMINGLSRLVNQNPAHSMRLSF
jgi:hypothetical protein